MSDPQMELTRIGTVGSAVERSALESARRDRPSPAARQAALREVLANYQGNPSRRSSSVAWLGFGSALLAAATVLLVQTRAPRPSSLGAEPRAEPTAPNPRPDPSAAGGFVPCTPLATASGQDPLIDDFEDGDGRAAVREHRAGQWVTYNDGTATQTPGAGMFLSARRIPGGRGNSHFGLHTSGGKFNKWGAVLGLELNPRRCYDASVYAGIEFYARGRGSIRTVVKMTQVVPEDLGGSCKQACFDGHGRRVELTRDFQLYRISWEELRQVGFGQPLPFDPRSLFSIEFWTLPEQTPFDYWIDDLSFFRSESSE